MKYTQMVKSIMVKSMDFKQLKAWAINHLKKQLKKEETKELSKALAITELMEKAAFPVGTIREWKGKKYIKTAPGKWMRKYDKSGRGLNQAIKNVMRKMEAAETPEELYAIIMQNASRFRDENGKMLPEVQQIHDLSQKKQSEKGNQGKISPKKDTPEDKKESKTEGENIATKGKFATDKQIDYVTEISNKKTFNKEKMLTKPVATIQKYANSNVEDFAGSVDEFIEYMADRQDGISLDEVAKEWSKLVNHNVARQIFEDYKDKKLVINDDGYFVENNETEEKNKKQEEVENFKTEIKDTINSYYNEMLNYTDWSTTSQIKKYGEKRLQELATKIDRDIDGFKDRLIKKAAEELEKNPDKKDEIISAVKNAVYSKAWYINLSEKAEKKLDTMQKNKMDDLPVDPKDKEEAISIIGSDVDRILSGRDTYGNAKQTLADKIKRRFRNNPAVCRAMLVYIREKQKETGKTVFTEKNSIWNLLPQLNENAMQSQKEGTTETKTGVSGNIYSGKDGTTIVENKDWGRYQIALPGKPEQKIITALKQHGFKWSPSTKTWVGFNTANGERKMHEMAEILGLEKEEMTKSFSKSMDLETLKKMVINHLKKQDKKELSKSLAVNEILQKANFPVGTVREWKGKKYKKIAPGKWARMYNSKGRGTNIAVGKLIARVNKIDNVEDLMKLCMEHKQRFADTDILNKIRAAVDAQNNKINGKENVSSNNTKTNNKTSSDLDELNNMLSQLNSLANKGKDRTKVYNELKKQYKDKLAKLGEKVKFDNAKGKYVETFETEKENVSSNKNDFKLNNNNYKHETSNKKTTEVVSYTVETPKKNIGEVINKGNNTVEIPSNKQAKFELEQLLKHRSDDKLRQFMNNVYYDEGKLIATNGRTLKTVQVGELGDIPNGSYVELDTKGKNIVIKEIQRPADRFPAWKRVMPEGYTNKASINGKALLDKIKEMEKDGSFAKNKDNRIVRLDIKDGQISLDGTVVGQTNDIQGSTNFQFTKDYLKNVLSPNDLTLMFSGRDDKERYAMSISNETSDNIIMPLWNGDREVTEYEKNRQEAKFAKEKEKTDLENKEKRNYSLSKDFYDMQTKQFDNLSPQKIATFQDGVKNAKNEQIEKWVKIANVDMDKLMKEKDFSNYSTFYKWTDKNYGVNQYNFVIYHKIFQNQELANTLFDEAQKRGISVKKSILVQVKDIFYGGNF